MEGRLATGATFDREAKGLDLKRNVLCEPCNNEWGSKLEDAAKPIVRNLAAGVRQILGLPKCLILTRWFVLKCMVLASFSDPNYFTEKERRDFRNKNYRVPPMIGVWAGRYIGQYRESGHLRDRPSMFSQGGTEEAVPGFEVTFSIGQLALQFFGLRWQAVSPDLPAADIQITNYKWDEAVVEVWPLPHKPPSWPPEKSLNDTDFELLTDRWSPNSKAKPEALRKPQPKPKRKR
jgi:hypothetical protein